MRSDSARLRRQDRGCARGDLRGPAGPEDVLLEHLHGVAVLQRPLDVGDAGAGVARALQDGYSTYAGLGLGLPGARRLMDEFAIASEVGRGTTVTMTRWCGDR